MKNAYRIDGSERIRLKDYKADDTRGITREDGEREAQALGEELVELQELLYAASDHSVLIVLQGRDTSGKDGTIRFLTSPLSASGCDVASFKVPKGEELTHDFLWRIHKQTPARGEMRIFNRSHYEDVLVVRVHNLAPEVVWKKRYEHINNFENMLVDAGTIILKFYLHIDAEEQENRLHKREQDATKFWKLSVGDWEEREHWDAYTEAYEAVINKCSSPHAPWYVVPANKKWYRNLIIARSIAEQLRPLKKEWLRVLEIRGEQELLRIQQFQSQHKANAKSGKS